MKKGLLLNATLSRVIAEMGHTDALVVCDAGLPIPQDVERIDLALRRGEPSFLSVLETVLSELDVERAIVASQIATTSPAVFDGIKRLLGDVPIEQVPHEQFKVLTAASRAVVRSGECTAFANVILHSRVAF